MPKFTPPTLEEVQDYCLQRRNGIDPEYFFCFYEANGWVQGKGRKPIVNWKACVITWEKRNAGAKQESKDFIERATDRSWAQ